MRHVFEQALSVTAAVLFAAVVALSGPGHAVVTASWAYGGGGTIDAGRAETCAVTSDGRLACWGSNAYSKISGANASADTFTQVNVGDQIACGLKVDGRLKCWGADLNSSVSGPNASTDTFTKVAAATWTTCGLKSDGHIACWGHNDYGRVSGPNASLDTFIDIDAAYYHTCGVTSAGRLGCWGRDQYGEVSGPNASTESFSRVSANSDTNGHTCAVRVDGRLRCWGYPFGSGSVSGPNASTDTFVDVSVSGLHTCGLMATQRLKCWGVDWYGQVSGPSASTDTFVEVAVGGVHTCALKTDGELVCWGFNEEGQVSGPNASTDTFGPAPGGPPVAEAGPDQSVNEQQDVTLDGTQSSDPDADALTFAWAQIGGAAVTLFDATTPRPTFTAPFVSPGGETLTFELTVTADGEMHTDAVNITVVNVNHTPVADAGDAASIAEGSLITLDGTGSFDADSDPITYAWAQQSGPLVAVSGADTATPSFTAPIVGGGGAPGIVATLVFRLVVEDGFPQDAPAPGYTFENVEDTLTIHVTNVNNAPAADAGGDQTLNENSPVTLNGSASSDPDGDALAFAWVQVGGPAVILTDGTTATPSLTTPFVSPGGADLTFQLTVDDGYGGTALGMVVVHVQNANDPPLVSAAQPTIACLWPPNHALVAVGITGVSDPNGNATIVIDGVTQDEPANGLGDGDTAVDAIINPGGTVLLRAERSGQGNGRVYHVHFTASDLEGSVSGVVTVCVPRDRKSIAVDGGELFESTQ